MENIHNSVCYSDVYETEEEIFDNCYNFCHM